MLPVSCVPLHMLATRGTDPGLRRQIGSVIIVLHAPSDKEVETVDEILAYASQPAFLFYVGFVTVFSLYMIFRVVPTHGTKNPMVYLSICSLVGSVSVMAIKVSSTCFTRPQADITQGFGVALKLTFAGNNQLTHMSTYVFAVVVVGCILVQMVGSCFFGATWAD